MLLQNRSPAFHGRVFWEGPFRGTRSDGTLAVIGGGAFGQMPQLADQGETDIDANSTGLTGVFGRLTRDSLAVSPEGRAAKLLSNINKDDVFPDRLNGDFALAWWRDTARKLVLATDHFSTRPLYYIRVPDGVAFASNIDALTQYSVSGDALFMPCVQDQLARTFMDSLSHTMVPDIKKVPPASRIEFTQDSTVTKTYWRPEDAPDVRYKRDAEYHEHARALLIQSVNDRIPGGVPYDTHLSSGLDSSSISAILSADARARGARMPDGYTWFPLPEPGDAEEPEQTIFRQCLTDLQMKGFSQIVCRKTVEDIFDCDPRTVPIMALNSEAAVMKTLEKRGTRVMFSGWGGDEALSFRGRSRWARSSPIGPRRVISRLRGRYKPPDIGFMKPEYAVSNEDPLPFWARDTPRLVQCFRLNFGHLSYRAASWSIVGAAHRVQYVYPMLDRRLIDFVLGVPPHLFDTSGPDRAMMRNTVHGVAPDVISKRALKFEQSTMNSRLSILRDTYKDMMHLVEDEDPQGPRAELIDLPRLRSALSVFVSGGQQQTDKAIKALHFLRHQTRASKA